MTSSDNDMSQFFSKALASILSSPHISMPRSVGNIRLGPGPIDLFTTKFINTFTEDVKANVVGQEMDRGQLKESLLNLQKYWNPATVQYVPEQSSNDDDCVRTLYTWTTNDSEQKQIQASGRVIESGGKQMINAITLDGDSTLFEK